jgi:PhnB protein
MPNYPNGKSSVTPYVVAKGPERLLDFMTKAFAADVYLTVPDPDGSIGHAEARIGDSVVMVFDSNDDWPHTPAFLSLYVEDVDATTRLAFKQGVQLVTEVVTSGITGDRGGRFRDPVGNIWWIQTHQHDISQEEMHAKFADSGELATMRRAQESFDQAMHMLGQ